MLLIFCSICQSYILCPLYIFHYPLLILLGTQILLFAPAMVFDCSGLGGAVMNRPQWTCTWPSYQAVAVTSRHCIDCSGLDGPGINRPGPNGLVEVIGTWPICRLRIAVLSNTRPVGHMWC